MFIKYQSVRNYVVGTITAAIATIAAFFGFKSAFNDQPNSAPTAYVQPGEDSPRIISKQPDIPSHSLSQNPRQRLQSGPKESPGSHVTSRASQGQLGGSTATKPAPSQTDAMYQRAIKIADGLAIKSGKGKDVLGASSPWKLNLYDDNLDGQYERAKLDTNRDEIDDEKWNLKDGRWERKGGVEIWIGDRWIDIAGFKSPKKVSPLERYVDAMNVLKRGSSRSEFAKDILGANSPWKLNAYDDDRDGQWDRAKLDINRDDVDDEKWNFKNGVWEKQGGEQVWLDRRWQNRASNGRTESVAQRYQNAFQLIAKGSGKSSQGKDILGSASPWKLNVYDDDLDGNWDRAKLDTNRDEIDDEKWNFKNGRWEKAGGAKIWAGDRWQSSSETTIEIGVSADTSRYRQIFKMLANGSRKSAKAKDLLGSQSPWKLNVYDDNQDGTWDRAKLDKNRDDVDDEKWNFKNRRWEKDNGETIWNGSNWIPAK